VVGRERTRRCAQVGGRVGADSTRRGPRPVPVGGGSSPPSHLWRAGQLEGQVVGVEAHLHRRLHCELVELELEPRRDPADRRRRLPREPALEAALRLPGGHVGGGGTLENGVVKLSKGRARLFTSRACSPPSLVSELFTGLLSPFGNVLLVSLKHKQHQKGSFTFENGEFTLETGEQRDGVGLRANPNLRAGRAPQGEPWRLL